jgi:hypothetical protein
LLGDQAIRTAVINSAVSARWEHECELDVGGEYGDDTLVIELLHCDRVGADKHLGEAMIKLTEIFKRHSTKGQIIDSAVERSFPVLNHGGDVVKGQDGKNTVLTVSFALLDNVPTAQSESEDDSSLPQSQIKASQHRLLQESRVSSTDSKLVSLSATSSSDMKSPAEGRSDSLDSKPVFPSTSSFTRGGVGLKFKVRSLPTRPTRTYSLSEAFAVG